jgi:hypothetical protein
MEPNRRSRMKALRITRLIVVGLLIPVGTLAVLLAQRIQIPFLDYGYLFGGGAPFRASGTYRITVELRTSPGIELLTTERLDVPREEIERANEGSSGQIDAAEFVNRLEKLGWSSTDSNKLSFLSFARSRRKSLEIPFYRRVARVHYYLLLPVLSAYREGEASEDEVDCLLGRNETIGNGGDGVNKCPGSPFEVQPDVTSVFTLIGRSGELVRSFPPFTAAPTLDAKKKVLYTLKWTTLGTPTSVVNLELRNPIWNNALGDYLGRVSPAAVIAFIGGAAAALLSDYLKTMAKDVLSRLRSRIAPRPLDPTDD